MIRGEEPIDRIRKAHNLVVGAANCWNAGSIAAVEKCAAVLEESAAELRAAEAAAAGRADSLRGIRSEILQIKERAARLERLSALAAALLRGGTESHGASLFLYRAGGFDDTDSSLTADPSAMTTMGIQA
jgi:hypothetical protein